MRRGAVRLSTRQPISTYHLCGIQCPDLPWLMGGASYGCGVAGHGKRSDDRQDCRCPVWCRTTDIYPRILSQGEEGLGPGR